MRCKGKLIGKRKSKQTKELFGMYKYIFERTGNRNKPANYIALTTQAQQISGRGGGGCGCRDPLHHAYMFGCLNVFM